MNLLSTVVQCHGLVKLESDPVLCELAKIALDRFKAKQNVDVSTQIEDAIAEENQENDGIKAIFNPILDEGLVKTPPPPPPL